ncbi:MAG: MerR family transcriptional regulator [Flavonifractor plautii]
MLSQVASLTGLEPYVIQNWVRRGFVAPPDASGTPAASFPASS